MDSSATRIDQGELLAQLGWVRALAQRLVMDPDVADDVLQRVCLLALEKAPDRARTGPGFRAWLATCTRRLARNTSRTETRRRRRELAASKVGPVSPTDEEAVRREMLRRVMEAVIELPEPHFSILVDRYYEGREVAEIAQRRGLKEAAVRQRLSRARRELRVRLGGGTGSGWLRAILPFGWLGRIGDWFTHPGGLVMAKQAVGGGVIWKLAAAGVLILITVITTWTEGFGWWAGDRSSQEGQAPAVAVAEAEAAEPGEPVANAVLPAPLARAAQPLVAGPAEIVTPVEPVATEPAIPISGRILDNAGEPVAGAMVLFGWNGDDLWSVTGDYNIGGFEGVKTSALSGLDGRFVLDAGASKRLAPDDKGPTVVVLRKGFRALARALHGVDSEGFEIGDLVLGPGASISGRIVDPAGEPVWSTHLQVGDPEAERRAFGTIEEIPLWFQHARGGRDGRFEVLGLAPGITSVMVTAKGVELVVDDQLSLAAGAAVDLGDIELPLNATVRGTVIDEDGEPIHLALARVVNQHGGLGAWTDERGEFVASGLAGGLYEVEVEHEGHVRARRSGVETDGDPILVSMRRYGAIEVRVVDAQTGLAMTKARLDATLPREAKMMSWSDYHYKVIAAPAAGLSEGSYRVEGAGPEGTELTVQADGYVSVVEDVPGIRSDETHHLTVTLQPEIVMVGRVVDAADAPISGARVTAMLGDDERTLHVSSLDDGSFRLGELTVGEWRVTASSLGFESADAIRIHLDGTARPEPLTIVLQRAGAITGIVRDAAGEPAPGLRVVATARAEDGMSWNDRLGLFNRSDAGEPFALNHATTDAAGRFRFPHLPAARYAVWVSRKTDDRDLAAVLTLDDEASWSESCTYVDVRSDETVTVNLWLKPPSIVYGRVTARGVPVTGAALVLAWDGLDYREIRPGFVAKAMTDELGQYEIAGVTPGDYVLFALAPGPAVPTARPVRLAKSDRLLADFDFTGDVVGGQVEDKRTGEPVSGVTVRLQPGYTNDDRPAQPWGIHFGSVAGNILRPGLQPFRALSDDAGSFAIRHVLPGNYTLNLSGAGYLPEMRSITINGKHAPEPMTIAMVRGAVIEGVVEAVTGTVPDGLNIGVVNEAGQIRGWFWLKEGHFRFDSLEPGLYVVKAFLPSDYDTPLGSSQLLFVTAGQSIETTLLLDH